MIYKKSQVASTSRILWTSVTCLVQPHVCVQCAVCNRVMVAQVDYHIRAEQSINGKETTEYIHKVSMI